jgi:hypothetical protein
MAICTIRTALTATITASWKSSPALRHNLLDRVVHPHAVLLEAWAMASR